MRCLVPAFLTILPLMAQAPPWSPLPPSFWEARNPKGEPALVHVREAVHLNARQVVRERRLLLNAPAEIPAQLTTFRRSGRLLVRISTPDQAPRVLSNESDFLPGPLPGTVTLPAVPAPCVLDVVQMEEGLPVTLPARLGPKALAWFPLPDLHRRIPMGAGLPLFQAVVTVPEGMGAIGFNRIVETWVVKDVSDGTRQMTELRQVPAQVSKGLELHWFLLPPGLDQAQEFEASQEMLRFLQDTLENEPSGGLFWLSRRKPLIDGLPGEPGAAAQEILRRLREKVRLSLVEAADVADAPEQYRDLPNPWELTDQLKAGIAARPGMFHLAHRLVRDAGIPFRIRFAVDPAQGTYVPDLCSPFQFTHLFLGFPGPGGTWTWLDPAGNPADGFKVPPTLAGASGLTLDGRTWKPVEDPSGGRP